MKRITLPTMPESLPDDVEVRDFDIGGGKFARVIMEVRTAVEGGAEHYVLGAQAYEMDKKGHMVQAPLGYPSRSARTEHSVIASSMNRTVTMDDGWVEYPMAYAPDTMPEIPVVKNKPTEPGTQYDEKVFCSMDQKVYRWAEGFADTVARTKIEDLLTVLATSHIRSGFAFRNRQQ